MATKLQGEAVVAGLPWQSADGLTWAGCGRGLLQDLAAGAARPTVLQQVCAGVLATLLRRLIQTGRIPSTDPVQALRVLSQDPMDLFIEGGNAKVIGEWFRRHFDPLRKPLAEISSLDGPEAVEDWLRVFFEYVENPTSATLAALTDRVEKGGAAQVSRFLRLATIWKPLVLVADHMDGLYRDVESGVAVARMALALASLPGVHVVLSMNQDLWETTFGRQLPSALEDRLSARSVALRGLTVEDSRSLVALRLTEAGLPMQSQREFLEFLDLDRFFLGRPIGSVSARGLLRHASQMWRHWLRADETQPVASTPPPREEAPAPLPLALEPTQGFVEEPLDSTEHNSADASDAEVASNLSIVEPEEESDDLEKLAVHLAADAGAKVVNLAGEAVELTSPVPLPFAGEPPESHEAQPEPALAPVAQEPAPVEETPANEHPALVVVPPPFPQATV
ncbi:MAG: hypothetical protein ACOYMN_14620, partial [Roseimicrobium sp.]